MGLTDKTTLLLRFLLELIPLLIKWFFTDEEQKKVLIKNMKGKEE